MVDGIAREGSFGRSSRGGGDSGDARRSASGCCPYRIAMIQGLDETQHPVSLLFVGMTM